MPVHLKREIENLKKKILSLGARVEESLRNAGKALLERNARLAVTVISGDAEIDKLEVEIEEDCLNWIIKFLWQKHIHFQNYVIKKYYMTNKFNILKIIGLFVFAYVFLFYSSSYAQSIEMDNTPGKENSKMVKPSSI